MAEITKSKAAPAKAAKLDALTEWAQHWPFQRASPGLILQAQREEHQRRLEQSEPAPF